MENNSKSQELETGDKKCSERKVMIVEKGKRKDDSNHGQHHP